MPPQTPPHQNTPQPTINNPLSVMQLGETTIFELKRHPIGIFIVYIATGIVLTILAVLAFVVLPSASTGSEQSQIQTISGLFFILFAFICLLFNFVATIIYWGNRWILTSDSITQISQTTLFHKESSQLSLESLEDVTAEQSGILTHIFSYGVVKAETAAQRGNFIFTYCPKPTYYAHKILQARENLDQGHNQPTNQNMPPANPNPNINTSIDTNTDGPPPALSSNPADYGITSKYQQ